MRTIFIQSKRVVRMQRSWRRAWRATHGARRMARVAGAMPMTTSSKVRVKSKMEWMGGQKLWSVAKVDIVRAYKQSQKSRAVFWSTQLGGVLWRKGAKK